MPARVSDFPTFREGPREVGNPEQRSSEPNSFGPTNPMFRTAKGRVPLPA